MGTANRYCVDCGTRLNYYARLSNPKAPNEHRVLVYGCPSCTVDFEKPKLLAIKTNSVNDPLITVQVEIYKSRNEEKPPPKQTKSSNKTR